MRSVAVALVAVAACGHHAADEKTVATLDGEVTALAAQGDSLYAGVINLGQTSIVKLPKTGGAPATVVPKPGIVRGIAILDGSLAWAETSMESDSGSGAVVITGEQIAKAGGIAEAVSANTDHPARILTVPLAGGTPTEVAKLAAVPMGLAADAKEFYLLSLGVWPKGGEIDPMQGSVIAVPRAGGAPRVVVDHLVRASQLAFDGTDLSWTADGQRWKVGKAGGTPQKLGAAPDPKAIVAVDGATTFRAVTVHDRATITAR